MSEKTPQLTFERLKHKYLLENAAFHSLVALQYQNKWSENETLLRLCEFLLDENRRQKDFIIYLKMNTIKPL